MFDNSLWLHVGGKDRLVPSFYEVTRKKCAIACEFVWSLNLKKIQFSTLIQTGPVKFDCVSKS